MTDIIYRGKHFFGLHMSLTLCSRLSMEQQETDDLETTAGEYHHTHLYVAN